MSDKKLYVVIHLINENNINLENRTLKQAKIAFDNGADGIFIIPAEVGITCDDILKCYYIIRNSYKNEFIGINFMLPADIVGVKIPNDANALWTDFGVGSIVNYDNINLVSKILKERKWRGLYFGGFYFKGNNSVIPNDNDKIKTIAEKAKKYIDVLTTSGPSTGVSINIDDLKKINDYSYNLALASGVSIDNINDLLPYAKYFIVGTGVEKTSEDKNIIDFYKSAGLPMAVSVGDLDRDKINSLATKIHNYSIMSV